MPKDSHLVQIAQRLKALQANTQNLYLLNLKQLNYKPDAKSWSVAECLEHLMLSNKGYIDNLEKAIVYAQKNDIRGRDKFSPSWLEAKFIHMLKPDSTMKMPAPATLMPVAEGGSNFSKDIVENFEKQLELAQKLCREADGIHLKRIKIRIPLLPILRIRMGAAFEIIATHNERHFIQIAKVLAKQPELQDVKSLAFADALVAKS